MENLNRARQFMPFDALKGLQTALLEKEKIVEARKELAEESIAELNEQFKGISVGDCVKIVFYKNEHYMKTSGRVECIDSINKKIVLDNSLKISLCDIIKLER